MTGDVSPAAGADTTTTTGAQAAPAIVSGGEQTPTTPPAGGAGDPPATTDAGGQGEQNWRHRIAGDDKGYLKTLERYPDEVAFGRAHRALQQKLSSGEYKQAPEAFPEKGTDEQKAEWRKLNGVPVDAKEYKPELPNGVVLGEADKPGAERLAAFAHEKKWNQSTYNDVLAAYYNELDAVKAEREQIDADHRVGSEEALRQDWGGDYRRNVMAVDNWLATQPKVVKERLMSGRTADGRMIANDAEVIKWLASVAMADNPAIALMPAGQQNLNGVGGRLTELRKLVANRQSEYYRGPSAPKLQREFQELLAVEARMKSSAA